MLYFPTFTLYIKIYNAIQSILKSSVMKQFRLYILALSCCIITLTAAAQDNTPVVKVSGEVSTPLSLSAADLSKMSRTTATLHDRDGKAHTYTGAPIREILSRAGVTTGSQLRGENLSKYLLVKCADGYEVLFSLAELDSSFTDRVIILSDTLDGGPLPTGKGPFRLVVPGEKKPARSSFQVTEMVIRFAKD